MAATRAGAAAARAATVVRAAAAARATAASLLRGGTCRRNFSTEPVSKSDLSEVRLLAEVDTSRVRLLSEKLSDVMNRTASDSKTIVSDAIPIISELAAVLTKPSTNQESVERVLTHLAEKEKERRLAKIEMKLGVLRSSLNTSNAASILVLGLYAGILMTIPSTLYKQEAEQNLATSELKKEQLEFQRELKKEQLEYQREQLEFQRELKKDQLEFFAKVEKK